MKLNNNGWSLGREVFYIIIFAVCLIIAIIGIIKMNLFMGKMPNSDTFNYSSLETKLVNASISYLYNKEKISNYELITSKTLITNGYIDNFVDGAGEECNGYVEATTTDEISYKAFVSCYNYTTTGYSSKKAKNE